MISPNLQQQSENASKFQFSASEDKTMNKVTNFSIAAIMNRQKSGSETEDEFEAKRRKLAEAVPALGKQ